MSKQEIEAKILEIDRVAVEKRLVELGAQFKFTKEYLAIYFDDDEGSLRMKGQTIRMRKEGDEIVLCRKQATLSDDPNVKVMEESEVPVHNQVVMERFLEGKGYKPVLTTRKSRTAYQLEDIEVVIDDYMDDYEFIPVFMEIEAPTKEQIFDLAAKLGFEKHLLQDMNTAQLINHYRND